MLRQLPDEEWIAGSFPRDLLGQLGVHVAEELSAQAQRLVLGQRQEIEDLAGG